MDDDDIINEKLKTLNRDSIAFEKTRKKLFEIPNALEKEIEHLKDKNKTLRK